jgi:hypothetical protein
MPPATETQITKIQDLIEGLEGKVDGEIPEERDQFGTTLNPKLREAVHGYLPGAQDSDTGAWDALQRARALASDSNISVNDAFQQVLELRSPEKLSALQRDLSKVAEKRQAWDSKLEQSNQPTKSDDPEKDSTQTEADLGTAPEDTPSPSEPSAQNSGESPNTQSAQTTQAARSDDGEGSPVEERGPVERLGEV